MSKWSETEVECLKMTVKKIKALNKRGPPRDNPHLVRYYKSCIDPYTGNREPALPRLYRDREIAKLIEVIG